MDQDSFNYLSAVISIITLVGTIVGLVAVYVQIKKIKQAAWSNTHSKLCDQSFELLRFFNENPSTYEYFYQGKVLEQNAPERVSILYATEALANFLEHLILQKDNLPPKQWEVWDRFIYTTFKSSVVIRAFLQDHREWYSAELLHIADECKLRY